MPLARMQHATLQHNVVEIGSSVQLADGACGGEFRVTERFHWSESLTLYRIKCATEPFDRLVAEHDLSITP